MVAITNYSTLVSAIQEVSENDGSEFLAYIPKAVALAEDMLFKDLDLEGLEVKVSGVLSAGSPYLSKPSGYEFANYINITVSNKKLFLKKRQEDFIIDYWPNASETGVPKYYGDSSITQFYLAPTPTLSYPYEIKYVAKPTKLTSTNPINYYITYCSDLLFYATMIQMSIFTKATEQLSIWTTAYTATKEAWNNSGQRTRRDNGAKPHNTDNGPNIVTQSV